MNTHQKGFAPILILIIALLLAGGGYVAYKKGSAPAFPSPSAAAPPSEISPPATSGQSQPSMDTPEGRLQGLWKPEQFSVFDPTLGQYRPASPPTKANYVEFKGSLSCPDGSIDEKGMPVACRQYAPFTVVGGTLKVQEGSQTFTLAFAFAGDKLELVMQPPAGSNAPRTKMILVKWLGVTAPSPAASTAPANPIVSPMPVVAAPSKTPAPTPLFPKTTKSAAPAALDWPQATVNDLAKACGGTFTEYAPSTSRDGEYHYYFERKETNSDLQIYVEVLDLRDGIRPYDWMTASFKYQSELKREPPYVITQQNFAGDASALIPDAGVGAKAVVRKGDYFVKLEERSRVCTTANCPALTCANGFPGLAKTVIDRLKIWSPSAAPAASPTAPTPAPTPIPVATPSQVIQDLQGLWSIGNRDTAINDYEFKGSQVCQASNLCAMGKADYDTYTVQDNAIIIKQLIPAYARGEMGGGEGDSYSTLTLYFRFQNGKLLLTFPSGSTYTFTKIPLWATPTPTSMN